MRPTTPAAALMCAALLTTGCTNADDGGPAEVTGTVAVASDVLTEPSAAQQGGQVWFAPPDTPGYGGPAPDRTTAAATLPIDEHGTYAGNVPAGEWRPCLQQPSRQPVCADTTVTIDQATQLHILLGDGFLTATT